MWIVYGHDMCPDCRECKVNFDRNGVEYEYADIGRDLRKLKAFLKLRDESDAFAAAKANGLIGIPAICGEDGSVTLDWESILTRQGLPVTYREERPPAPSCSLDGKKC